MNETLTIGELEFELRRSARRKTIGITVDRDGSLLLHVPTDCPRSTIERVAETKQVWVHTKLAEKEMLNASAVQKEYVAGESFYYLGRRYRLRFVDDEDAPELGLYGGYFEMRSDVRDEASSVFVDWYQRHAKPWLEKRCERFFGKMGVDEQELGVRDLGYRWGSCGVRALHFHWRTILLPPRIIDYVIVHELAHVDEPNHDEAFWKTVERAMPDYQERKRWLAENGARYVA
ncbi:MAG: M48 family metallopeptidase [Myxococcota bacterium]